MMTRIVLLLIASVLLSQSVTSSQRDQATAYEDADAYEVYSAILPFEWPMSAAKAKMLVIRIKTRAYEMCLRPNQEWKEMIEPAIADYEKQNQKTWLLQQRFGTEIPCKIVTSDEVNAAMVGHSWEGFYKTYPDSGGWIELSAVGFNADRTVAVVYVGHLCGLLCGGGRFHVLQKTENKWLPVDWKGSSCMWAS
jgi:hypothetical protein